MNIKPLGDRILVKAIKQEEIRGGIVLPDTADKEKKEQGEIVSVGEGEKISKLNLKPGQTVMFGKYSGDEIEVEGEKFRFLKHDEILAVIE